MDRLHAVILVGLISLVGCDDKAKANAPRPQGRVNAVQAKTPTAQAPGEFCDVYHAADGDGAADFQYAELAGDAPENQPGWRWINIWATWCKPCVEEMPRLAAWESEMTGLGDVVFLSADDSDDVVTTFQTSHPDAQNDGRLADPESVKPWLEQLGYAGPSSLPVHIFVDGKNRTRCIRVGGVSDRDKPAIERLISG